MKDTSQDMFSLRNRPTLFWILSAVSLVSLYTNVEGIAFLTNLTTTVAYIGVLPIAFLISMLLQQVAINLIKEFQKENNSIVAVCFSVGFIVLFLISLFFNFNSFYSKSIREHLLKEEANRIKGLSINLKEQATNFLEDSVYNITIYKLNADTLKKKLVAESHDPRSSNKQIQINIDSLNANKIGGFIGEKSKALYESYMSAQAKLVNAVEQYDVIKNTIETNTDTIKKFTSVNSTKLANVEDLEKSVVLYNEIVTVVKAQKNSFQTDLLKSNASFIGKPSYSLQTLVNFKDGYYKDELFWEIVIAILTSLLIDIGFLIAIPFYKLFEIKENNNNPNNNSNGGDNKLLTSLFGNTPNTSTKNNDTTNTSHTWTDTTKKK